MIHSDYRALNSTPNFCSGYRVKRPVHEADHLTPSTGDFKKSGDIHLLHMFLQVDI
jgi:hypothetical protein